MAQKLHITTSPHVHCGDTIERNMRWVVWALMPALIVSFFVFGVGALIVTATSVLSCLFFEWFITRFILKRPSTLGDLSATITGILLAFNLPSNIPLFMIVVGALVAIGIGKMAFGGLGNNPFNPALVGRVFLLISFPAKMTSWPVPAGIAASYIDAETGATPLNLIGQIAGGNTAAADQLPSLANLFIGNTGGCIGEVSALVLLIGLVVLLCAKVITWHIPVSILSTVAVCQPALSSLLRRPHAGCHLYGYGLCDIAHDPQGYGVVWYRNRIPHGDYPLFRFISGGNVIRYPDHECGCSAH